MKFFSFLKSADMHAKYKLEKTGVTIIENSYGFITYMQKDRTLCVLELYVLPKFRGEGRGAELMEKVQKIASEAGLSVATVIDPSDEHAPALKAIFQKIGLTKMNHIDVRMDCYVGVS